MVMTIRNTCRIFNNLFQLVRNREMKRLNSPNISVGGFEPVSVVYIEVSNIKKTSVRGCEDSKDSWQEVRYSKKEGKLVALVEQWQKQRKIVVVGVIFLAREHQSEKIQDP